MKRKIMAEKKRFYDAIVERDGDEFVIREIILGDDGECEDAEDCERIYGSPPSPWVWACIQTRCTWVLEG